MKGNRIEKVRDNDIRYLIINRPCVYYFVKKNFFYSLEGVFYGRQVLYCTG